MGRGCKETEDNAFEVECRGVDIPHEPEWVILKKVPFCHHREGECNTCQVLWIARITGRGVRNQ